MACGELEPITLTEFAALAPEATCDWAVRCRHVPDRPTCERLLDPKDYDIRRSVDSIAAGRAAYDGVAAARCIAETREQFCLIGALAAPSCRDAIRGLVPEGGACTSSRECADDAACALESCPDQCCLGRCGPPRDFSFGTADFGEACENHGDCRPEAYCETDRRCTRFPDAEGERCLFGCSRGDLYCDLETLTCRRYGAAGELCDPAAPGAVRLRRPPPGPLLGGALWTPDSRRVARQRSHFVATPYGRQAPPCDPAWAVCDGVCRPRPGLGERCDGQDRLCIPTTLCDLASGTCVARRQHGEPCDSSEQCRDQCDLGAGACAPYDSCD